MYDLGEKDELHVRAGVTGDFGRLFPTAYITLCLARKPGYYVANAYVPMAVFVPIACMQWSIPPWHVADRLSFGLGMLLIVIAFRVSLAARLPAVSYTPPLDEFVISYDLQ